MGHPPDENLPEVVPDQSPQALTYQEAAYRQQQLEGQAPMYPAIYDDSPKYATPGLPDYSEHTPVTAMSPNNGTLPWEPVSAVDNLNAGDEVPPSEKATVVKEEPMIFGLKRKVFWLLVALVLVIIGASVGGGVGGGIAAARSRDGGGGGGGGSAAPAASSSSSTPTPTNAPTATSSSPPLPSFLFNETTPSTTFMFQGYSDFAYGGNHTPVVVKEGFYDMPFLITSYVWLPNKTNCCISFCKDAQSTDPGGWWCQEKWQPQASGKFGRIWIGCGDEAHKQHACQ